MYVRRACRVLYAVHALSHQGNKNRNRVFADVSFQYLRLFVRAVYLFEQLKSAIFIY